MGDETRAARPILSPSHREFLPHLLPQYVHNFTPVPPTSRPKPVVDGATPVPCALWAQDCPSEMPNTSQKEKYNVPQETHT